jgi:DNA-binding NtrC family response regulator
MARILLIDDEPDLLDIMRKALCNATHDVTAVGDGSRVVRGETGVDFDVVVTDIIMPETEGIETLTYLKEHNPRIRIVAISGGGTMDANVHVHMAERSGAFRTLGKPFPLWALVEAVEDALSQDGLAEATDPAPAPATLAQSP